MIFVQEVEREMWSKMTAIMMSDEEDVGENTFKVHPPEWRSGELNELLKLLDARADSKAANRAHPRCNQIQGMPLKTDRPPNVSAWMGNDAESDFDAAPGSPLIL